MGSLLSNCLWRGPDYATTPLSDSWCRGTEQVIFEIMAFNEADTAHGLVKRRLVKGYCGGLFARELESTKFKSVPSGHYCVQYVDAFSWRGAYGGPNTRNSQSMTDQHEDDIEKMGSPIIALDRGLDRCKEMTKRSFFFPSQDTCNRSIEIIQLGRRKRQCGWTQKNK